MTSPKELKAEPLVLSEVDRLRLENAQLRLMTMERDHTLVVQELQRVEDLMVRQRATYASLLDSLAKRYNFDPSTTEMEPGTGRVVPRTTAASPPTGSTR